VQKFFKGSLFILSLFISLSISAQADRIPLVLLITDTSPAGEKILNRESSVDSFMVDRKLRELLLDFNHEGYLAASIDSISYKSDKIVAYCHKGLKYKWIKVTFDSVDPAVLRRANIRTKKYDNRWIDPRTIVRDQQRLIGFYENSGYPFASVRLDQIQFDGEKVEAEMILEKGHLMQIDSIIIKGNARISPKYFERQIGITRGDIYSERKIRAISDRIKETTFIREIKPFELEFFEGSADIYTYLEKVKASQFNGIIGIIPNYEKTGRLLLTGDISFSLVNPFGRGTSFGLNWKKPEPFTQELKIQGSYPYILSYSVGLGFDLFLLKEDTTYFMAEPEAELRFFLEGSDYIRVFYRHQGSSLLSTYGFENITHLPPYADINTSLYGAGILLNRLDYFYNPRRGIFLEADLSIGKKKIRKSPQINQDVYEAIDLSTTKTIFDGFISFFIPLGSRFTLQIRNISGHIMNEHLFENELYRLGGIHNLRGVDENSVLASTFIFSTLEFRYLFEEQSNIFLFFDQGYYQKDLSSGFSEDTPMGFGAGMNLQTRAGIFTIIYAMGRQFDNPVNIGNAKVHFGYISRF
jgi:outer membrane protein assembly factor BamA